MVRKPKYAGSFYPASSQEIITFIDKSLPRDRGLDMMGCVLPHAGWVFSGHTALKTLGALGEPDKIRRCVIFGAVHHYGVSLPVISSSEAWETPLGIVNLDRRAYEEMAGSGMVEISQEKHRDEHSIEVLVPFVQYLMPGAEIFPVLIPFYIQQDLSLYVRLFSILKGEDTLFVASSDLTHYGINYGDNSMGSGKEAVNSVRKNDMLFADLVKDGDPEEIIPYAIEHRSACGAGGIALLKGIAGDACTQIVDYSNSCEIYPQGGCSSFVTYCGMAFVRGPVSP